VGTRFRHNILALTVVVISSAAPSIQHELGLSLVTMSWIFSSFRWGYALFQIPGGWLGRRRAGPECGRVECVHLDYGPVLERGIDGDFSLPVGHRRGRSDAPSIRDITVIAKCTENGDAWLSCLKRSAGIGYFQ
jgi:hypothetical protein